MAGLMSGNRRRLRGDAVGGASMWTWMWTVDVDVDVDVNRSSGRREWTCVDVYRDVDGHWYF